MNTKNIINIDNRLKEIASLIDKCNLIADIGTDHGYLPIYLIQNNIVKKAIASDVAINPLNKAIENIDKYNLNDKITPILSNGLDKIPNNVDCIIMAGMGANLIADILSNAKYKYKSYILQANLNLSFLRKYLMENDYTIVDEKVVYVSKKYYEILKVTLGHSILDAKQIKYGPINLLKKSQFFINKWQEQLNTYKRIVKHFKGSEDELYRLNNEINDIENMLSN